MAIVKIVKKLKKIDWNFDNCKTNYATHDLHSYPARFIPQIPNNLIKIFTKENDIVYDPFCGCGTTILEAILENRKAIGNDMNPLAVLISKAKSTPLTKKQTELVEIELGKIETQINELYGVRNLFNRSVSKKKLNYRIPNLDYWFSETVVRELSLIKNAITSLQDKNIINFLKAVFSNIIVLVSYQDSNTRYVRVEKKIKPMDTFKKFKARTLRMTIKMAQLQHIIRMYKPKVKVADTRKHTGFKENFADFVVTSPPYPNAYDYHLYHKHRMYWLDMDPLELKKKEIGAHAHYSKKNGFTDKNFREDMTRAFKEISRVLKNNRYMCVVIGDSIIKGKRIKNNLLLKKTSKQTPFDFEYEFRRHIKLTKKSFNPKIGKIKTEHIMIFRNNKT